MLPFSLLWLEDNLLNYLCFPFKFFVASMVIDQELLFKHICEVGNHFDIRSSFRHFLFFEFFHSSMF